MTTDSSYEGEQPGFEVPIRASLAQPMQLGGVPSNYAILTGTTTAVLGLGLQQLWLAFPLFLVMHGVGVWLTKRDAFWLQIFRRHLFEKNFYEA